MSHDFPSSRFVVCSDIHANFAALRTFFKKMDRKNISRIYCLGDSVGYGADPNECCDVLRNRNIPAVLGNHDQAAACLDTIENFNHIAREAIIWTYWSLSTTNREYLKSLPYVIHEGDFLFVHASPCHPKKWNYVLTLADAGKAFKCFDEWICFIGHSHQPFVVELSDGEVRLTEGTKIELDRKKRYLVNVGSIGQPRDHFPQSAYVSVDQEKNLLMFHRLEYPIKEAQQAILNAGLPPELAERLAYGW